MTAKVVEKEKLNFISIRLSEAITHHRTCLLLPLPHVFTSATESHMSGFMYVVI